MNIAVLGSGAFGTALAISLASKAKVTLWSRSPEQVAAMQRARENKARLPGLTLPRSVEISADLDSVAGDSPVLLAVPMQQLRAVLLRFERQIGGRTLVACCKGIELNTGLGPVSVIRETLPSACPALLTGPSFAADIARGLPTALTLACADEKRGVSLQQSLSTGSLRLYRTTDTIGAELGGALKNVMAIACGAVIGAGLGESARAALMTRGYAEMQRMALALSARPETLAGLSGFGDLALTCTSDQSRNYQLGHAIGQGRTFDGAITVEGAATAQAVAGKAAKMRLDMPITKSVVALLDKTLTIEQAMAQLLARPLKEE
jgi:glycerol-3-phosphate dehydrogenase (NAD(P)+)